MNKDKPPNAPRCDEKERGREREREMREREREREMRERTCRSLFLTGFSLLKEQ